MPQGGTVLGVFVQRLNIRAVPVPPLDFGQLLRVGDVEVGEDEAVPVDRIQAPLESQSELVFGNGATFAARSVGILSTGMRVRRAMQDTP